MEVWDDDSEEDGDDLIDQFIITILDTIPAVNESEPMILKGVNEIGTLTLAYCSFTTDQLFPSCSSADIPTMFISSPNKSYMYIVNDCTILYIIRIYFGN